VTPTDNNAVMLLFDEVTSARWQVKIAGCVVPEIGVVRIGAPLQMPHPIHQGFRPFENNRTTQMRGVISERGEWIGRSTLRNYLEGQFRFPNLTPAFISASLSGPYGWIQSMEKEPFFIAWRPATYPVAYYCWTPARVSGPTYEQSPNLSTFAFTCQAYGFE
jgi:hypothetical protein